MSATETRSATEVLMSMTGYDEIAVARSFGRTVAALKEDPFMFLRAMSFVTARRDGMKDREAYQHVMDLTLGQLGEAYEDDPEAAASADQDAEGNAP